jgi:hypothetical protein
LEVRKAALIQDSKRESLGKNQKLISTSVAGGGTVKIAE